MHIRIIQIGKTRESYLKQGEEKYWEVLGPYCKLETITLSESKLRKADVAERIIRQEGDLILEALSKDPQSMVITLEVTGELHSSSQFSSLIRTNRDHGPGSITFVIGGAFGLDPRVSEKAKVHLSFSTFTFTHELIRLLLLEQIFRAFTIIQGKTYHY